MAEDLPFPPEPYTREVFLAQNAPAPDAGAGRGQLFPCGHRHGPSPGGYMGKACLVANGLQRAPFHQAPLKRGSIRVDRRDGDTRWFATLGAAARWVAAPEGFGVAGAGTPIDVKWIAQRCGELIKMDPGPQRDAHLGRINGRLQIIGVDNGRYLNGVAHAALTIPISAPPQPEMERFNQLLEPPPAQARGAKPPFDPPTPVQAAAPARAAAVAKIRGLLAQVALAMGALEAGDEEQLAGLVAALGEAVI